MCLKICMRSTMESSLIVDIGMEKINASMTTYRDGVPRASLGEHFRTAFTQDIISSAYGTHFKMYA